ncbi:MAG: AAA family ATPase [Chitinivibrionales bacterium]|nr:AAA family ATPase [Chitinivibrionales bacterium]MBD3357391.1 AAA family ATPase [Chitinivibrionales bacterium]
MKPKSTKTLIFTDTDNGGIIHVANIKGGVGKSTVATNLACNLSRRGPTLIVDIDVQGSASHAFGMDPADAESSAWDLFARRFAPVTDEEGAKNPVLRWMRRFVRKSEEQLLPWVVGRGDVTSIAARVRPCLDLIPAGSGLYKHVSPFHLRNLLYNIALCRSYYKYIIVDTPSVWNATTRSLYLHADLNLIPVTLNALSTRSLRDYLINVRQLADRHADVRIRIVKNEVYGRAESKIKGKTRTMHENRRFLEGLCEQVVIRNESGVSMLPQSIIFDLEIPESATVRDAQDEGKAVREFKQYSSAARAFEKLAQMVQYVLNNPLDGASGLQGDRLLGYLTAAGKCAAAAVLVWLLAGNSAVSDFAAPRPIAPQQLVESPKQVITHTFSKGESLHRVAKYAICRFRAIVPSMKQVDLYAREMVAIHNRTRLEGETKIGNYNAVEPGVKMDFYPPHDIANPRQRELAPAYHFFTSLVKDPFAYVTGDWCERGSGGGDPHYGIDVAAVLGTEVVSPISGTAVLQNGGGAGRMVGVVNDGAILFFAHMDKRYFKTGEKVEAGSAVGTIGMTGRTSGPHVHIGYGLVTPGRSGMRIGRRRYKVTDPKLFFYREQYLQEME